MGGKEGGVGSGEWPVRYGWVGGGREGVGPGREVRYGEEGGVGEKASQGGTD